MLFMVPKFFKILVRSRHGIDHHRRIGVSYFRFVSFDKHAIFVGHNNAKYERVITAESVIGGFLR